MNKVMIIGISLPILTAVFIWAVIAFISLDLTWWDLLTRADRGAISLFYTLIVVAGEWILYIKENG